MPMVDQDSMLESLRTERDRFLAFAFAAADLVIEMGADGKIAFAAGAGRELLGVEIDRLIDMDFFTLLSADDRAGVSVALASVEVGARSEPLVACSADDSGSARNLDLRAYRPPDKNGAIFVTIRGAGPRDGLSTPRVLRSVASEPDVARFSRIVMRRMGTAIKGDTPLALTLIALEGLANAPIALGGERVMPPMSAIADLLRLYARGGDDVGHIGPGKIGVVHAADRGFGSIAAEIDALAKRLHQAGTMITVHARTVSLDSGQRDPVLVRTVLYTLNKFVESPAEEFTIDSLGEARRAMLSESIEWSSRIRRTVGEGRFSLAFQPIVDMSNRRVHHFEALLRLPEHGGVTPYKFITMAEQLGSIAEFDLAVAERVIDVMARSPIGRESIAINVSGRSLVNPSFVDALIARIRRNADLAPHLLFEVTESAKITDLHAVNRALQTLRQSKIRVCLDDFGTGASAFEYLRSLHVDILKIDGSFIRDAAISTFNRAFIRSIASLCDGLGITTIAEMVEDETAANVVREAGITHGQGYLFGKPTTLERFGPPPAGLSLGD